jgi:hypothetical protein
MEDIKFNLDIVEKIESDFSGMGIWQVMTDLSLHRTISIVRRCLGVSKEDAREKIDQYLKDGGTMGELIGIIQKKFEEAGFLGSPKTE